MATNVFHDATDSDVWGGVFGDVWEASTVTITETTVGWKASRTERNFKPEIQKRGWRAESQSRHREPEGET